MPSRAQEAKDFAHFENLEAIRKRPSMYLGSLAPEDGVWTIWREILDNGVDELANRNVKRPTLVARYLSDGYFEVLDNGGGIPTEPMPGHKVSVLEFVTSRLHAGGKFGTNDVNRNTRGTHGVGLKGATGLSIHAKVMTFRSALGQCVEYRNGKLVGKGLQDLIGADTADFRGIFMDVAKVETRTGTWIRFSPDIKSFFTIGVLRPEEIEAAILQKFTEWADISVGLHPGLTIHLQFGDCVRTFHNEEGLLGMVRKRIEQEQIHMMGSPFEYHAQFPAVGPQEAWSIDLVLAFTDYDGFGLQAYTNSLLNSEGGVHSTAVVGALTSALKRFATKDRDREALIFDNVRQGLIGIVNIKIDEPVFGSQTKEKLVDTRLTKPCTKACEDAITEFFLASDTLAFRVIQRCTKIDNAKAKYAKTRAQLQQLTDNLRRARMPLPLKLRQAPDCAPEERELYVVEGDSALGTATLARDARFQEILPLRGKILNAMKAKDPTDAILSNKELLNVLMAIGYNPELKDPLSRIRIGKFILLTDADVDGHHIRTLFYALFHVFMRQLIERGVLYQARTYEFMVREPGLKGRLHFADSIDELAAKVSDPAMMDNAMHLKGWGEINPTDFAVMAFDPRTRVLERVVPSSATRTEMFEQLMGRKADYRARLLGVDGLDDSEVE